MVKQRRPAARTSSKSLAKRRATPKTATKRKATPKTATKRKATSKTAAKRKATPKTAAKRKATPKTAAKRKATPKTAAKRKATPKTTAKRKATPKTAAKRKATSKTAAKRKATPKTAAKRKATPKTAAKRKATLKTAAKRKKPTPARTRRAERAPVVKIREAYAKAVALYEKGLKALQRKNYDGAATAFRTVLEQFPEERELHDRARLYLNVCERETGPKAKAPKSVDERILAATLALNRRDVDEALSLLRRTASSHPKHDHIQYMLALAHALRDDVEAAAEHLERAIALNPGNRLQAKQEPDFDSIRWARPFLDAIRAP